MLEKHRPRTQKPARAVFWQIRRIFYKARGMGARWKIHKAKLTYYMQKKIL